MSLTEQTRTTVKVVKYFSSSINYKYHDGLTYISFYDECVHKSTFVLSPFLWKSKRIN